VVGLGTLSRARLGLLARLKDEEAYLARKLSGYATYRSRVRNVPRARKCLDLRLRI